MDLWKKGFHQSLDPFLVAVMVLFSLIFIPLLLIDVMCPLEDQDQNPSVAMQTEMLVIAFNRGFAPKHTN